MKVSHLFESATRWVHDPEGGDGHGELVYDDGNQTYHLTVTARDRSNYKEAEQIAFIVRDEAGAELEEFYSNWDSADSITIDAQVSKWCKRHRLPTPDIDLIF